MCLAGDGGGKGSRSRRLAGVVGAEPAAAPGCAGEDLRGDAAEPPKRWCAGLGLGVENEKKGETAQCFFPGVAGVAQPGGGVAGAARGGEVSASWVSGFAWHPPMLRLCRGVAHCGRDLGGVVDGARRRRWRERPWRREKERGALGAVASGDCGAGRSDAN